MTYWIENPPKTCTFAWLRHYDHQGEHWARCDPPPGHGGLRHVSGVSWVGVGHENSVTYRWMKETP